MFRAKLNAQPIVYRDCKPEELVIADCVTRISTAIQNDSDVVLIGSSLGGFLAASVALDNPNVKKLILLNPAIMPPSVNINNYQSIPRRIMENMIDQRLFAQRIKADVTILLGTEDAVIPRSGVLEFAMVQEATIQFFHDDHRFTKNLTRLPDIISQMLER